MNKLMLLLSFCLAIIILFLIFPKLALIVTMPIRIVIVSVSKILETYNNKKKK
jgi:hypothetical protein